MISLLKELKTYKINPKKRLGQNFLLDDDILEQIISLYDLTNDDMVIEVGAGLGALTTRLAARAGKVIAIEIDKGLTNLLKDKMAGFMNVEVINKDVLDMDFQRVTGRKSDKVKVLGNIPFGISTPLVFKLLDCKDYFSMAILMFQKEVADRIVACPGTKAYGVLSVFSQLNAVVSQELIVRRQCFHPQPKVDSAVVKFLFYKTPPIQIKNEHMFKRVVKGAFAQRRKILGNALKNSMGRYVPLEQLLNAFKECDIDPRRRGETPSRDVALSRAVLWCVALSVLP